MRYLVTGKQAALIDRHTIEEVGVPQLVLMERASLALAEEVEGLVRDKAHDRILVVAESGNNGGDGVAAARILHQRGYLVEVWELKGLSKQSEAYKKQVELAKKAGVIRSEAPRIDGYRVVVDAIFGVGLTREVTGKQKKAVLAINEARENSGEMTVVAVDVPSGISSETGEILGAAVKADRTVTFGFEKVGMRFAKEYCGKVSVHEIGFFLPEWVGAKGVGEAGAVCTSYDREDLPERLPHRSPEGNKGGFGRVLVIAGSRDISGAAFLAAEAAYRTGCGLVKVLTHENNREMLQQRLPEALLSTYGDPSTDGSGRVSGNLSTDCLDGSGKVVDDIRWASVIILGPGLGQTDAAWKLTEKVLREASCPVIVDADAINLLAEHTELLTETAGRRPLIFTPHMLEMTRLSEKTQHPERTALEGLKKNRFLISASVAAGYQATVVLKDACTVVTDADGAVWLNSSGNAAMAKGGSGDVLTGVIAGLIAQGLPAEEAARLGVYIHGLAGDAARDELGAYSVIARDLTDRLPAVLGSVRSGR